MSRIFIDRPIFAWVIAIIIMLAGLGALFSLPNEQYPDIAPTQVNISATYPGASAEAIENSVTQIIEQSLTGIDGLLYFSSQSTNRGRAGITATFAKGIDPDIAQVQVQNRLQSVLSRLPQAVQQQGVTVTKSNPDTLLLVGVYDSTDTRPNQDVSDYAVSNLVDPLSRVEGVGEVHVFGSQHAMRVWLNPQKLAAVKLMPSDVINAIKNQNTEIPAGEIGGSPSPAGQRLNAILTARTLLETPEQFRKIVVKTLPDGSSVTVGDVGRVEIGAENYSVTSRANRHPATGVAISLAPGADSLRTADRVKAVVEDLATQMPEGLEYTYGNDSTKFIKHSISEVQKALFEAIILVVIVMFIFLQSWRATLIPAIAVPVVLLGTLAIFYLAGFSINSLTLFGLVLAIGLLVDDAIVVVENVERLMEENPGMSPRDATIESMQEIQVALVAIALVLSAVFLPMAFLGGSTGVIYRQFSLAIISAMVLSVLVALILSPALTATMLKAKTKNGTEAGWFDRKLPWFASRLHKFHDWFNNSFHRLVEAYTGTIKRIIARKWLSLGVYAVVCALLLVMFVRLPSGFIPTEDQGFVMVQYRLPPGATRERTEEAQHAVEDYFLNHEKSNTETTFTLAGGGFGASGQNTGQGFVTLTDWSERKGPANTADVIAMRSMAAMRALRDVQFFAMVPGSVPGLGMSSGFTMELQNSTGLSRTEFDDARDKLLELATNDSRLSAVRLSDLPDAATLNVQMDTPRLTAFGIDATSANSTLATAWGGTYTNDFIEKGRVKRVYIQGDAQYRAHPEDLSQWYVRASSGDMVPFSAFSFADWSTTPSTTSRFNGLPSYEFSGTPSPGNSTGDAMRIMEELAAQIPGVRVAWSGSSYQERLSSGEAPLLYALSLLVVFLCLAALYESWSIPVAVLLIIPLGLVGAVFAVTLRGLENDIFMKIGLLTTMGLAAKNAILMIEFAEIAEKKGMRIIDAAIEAARIRLRPILMTSLAFIFGVLPLALATGAGANSRVAIGTSVIGGMLTATVLAVFYIPLFFVLVRRSVRDGMQAARDKFGKHPEASANA